MPRQNSMRLAENAPAVFNGFPQDQPRRNRLNEFKQVLKRIHGGKKGFDGDDETQKFGQRPNRKIPKSFRPSCAPTTRTLDRSTASWTADRLCTLAFGLWTEDIPIYSNLFHRGIHDAFTLPFYRPAPPAVTRKSLSFNRPKTKSNEGARALKSRSI
jgi:hypothetical protein